MATEDSGKLPRFSQFSKAKQMEWKKKMMLFSFFLVVSVIIWLLNSLSKNYTTEIRYPIAYSKFPPNKMLVSDVPESLGLRVTAHGYALMSYKLTNRPIPLSFPVTSFAMNSLPGDTSSFYILTRYAREQVARQLPAELQLEEISPDTLIFRFANEVKRWVSVRPELTFKLGKNFITTDGVVISPESIRVSGPDIYLDTLQFARTLKMSLGQLQKDYSGVLKIDEDPRLNYSENRIACTISLEKLTEIQLQVPVQVNGLPDSLRVQTFPQQVRVTGKVGLSRYDRIVPEAFWIAVDYSDVVANKPRLEVSMKEAPEELKDAEFYPKTVEYLLSVK
jgi:hypothetical protein